MSMLEREDLDRCLIRAKRTKAILPKAGYRSGSSSHSRRYLYMPQWWKVSYDALKDIAGKTGIDHIPVIDDMGE